MAKTLAIKVKYSSEGEGKVIKNINELESAIEDLNEELRGLDFGSEEYKKTAAELNKLKSEFKDVEKSFEGLDTEAKLSALGGALDLVSGSFLIASSAARTFGASAESVEEVEKLEQQALEAVNIALGFRAVAEGIVQANLLKRVVAEKAANLQTKVASGLQAAYTAIVGTSTGALKAFRIALISTGIGAAVVAIGALIANWDKLTAAIFKSNDEADRFAEINEEAQKSIAKTNVELEFYAGIVNDVTKSENERLEALEELNKLGVITEDITLDQADALDILNERLELARENILLKAQAEAAASLLSEAFKEQIEAQNTSLEDNIGFWERTWNTIISGGDPVVTTLRNIETGVENQTEAVSEATDEVQRYEDIYLGILEKLNANEAKLRREREEADKNSKSRNKDKEDRNKLDAEYNKILEQLAKNSERVRQEIQLLATAERDESRATEDSVKFLEKQNELLQTRLDLLGDGTSDVADQLKSILTPEFDGIRIEDTLFTILRQVGSLNEVSRDAATELEVFEDVLTRIQDLDGVISDESLQILIDFFDTQVRLNEKTIEFNETYIQQQRDLISEAQALATQQLSNGEITIQQYQQRLNFLQLQSDEIDKLVANEVDYNGLLISILGLQEDSVEKGKSSVQLQEEINDLVAKELFSVESVNELNEEQKKLLDEVTASLLNQSKVYNSFTDVAQELLDIEKETNKVIGERNKKLSREQFNNLRSFVQANRDNLDEVKEFFATVTEENSALTEEQIDNIQRLIDGIEFNQKFSGIQEFADKVIQEFQNISSGIQSVLASSISLQLEQLDYYEAQILASIGDETERAKQLQEETRNEIAQTRFELEKKARLQELGFSLAGALANTAQSILKALATVPPPGGQILAGIYGGIGAAQALVIRDQINFVKSTQFQPLRRGGLIMGASHEEGGVMANGGLVLEGGEAVINKAAVSQFSDLLSQINVSTGGRALGVEDSALVQEIRKQNQRPIKTYVLYNDIQDTNKINSRLEQISRL